MVDIMFNCVDIYVILMFDFWLWGVNIDFIINKYDKWGDKDIMYIVKLIYFFLNIFIVVYLEYYGF